MKYKRLFALPVLALLLLSGCTTTDTQSVSAKAFSNEVAEQPKKAGKLSTGDMIEVSVEVDGSMEVNLHQAKLNTLGTVTLPLVGDVAVGGLTMDQARQKISKKYGEYYVRTPVTMVSRVDNAAGASWGYVTVLGRVSRPGRIAIKSAQGMTLSQAIQEAGGFAPSAKKTDVRVSRMDEAGLKRQVSIDFVQIGQEGNADADVNLIDGDIIYVPERIF